MEHASDISSMRVRDAAATAAAKRPVDPIPHEEVVETCFATSPDEPSTLRLFAFNTVVDVAAYAPHEVCEAAFARITEAARTYERLLSRTLPHSDISRINGAAGRPVSIAAETFDVLEKAIHYCEASRGTFDITIGPAVRLWNFHDGTIARREDLDAALPHIDWHLLELSHVDDGTPQATLADPQAALDVGGIAKGWIADRFIEALNNAGVSGAVVNLGGNVAVTGSKPDGEPWRIAIRNPADPSTVLGVVPLQAGSAVTSGIYERAFTAPDGTLYHHILSPRDGMPVTTDLQSATVICATSTDAEGFSTTLVALGRDAALDFARTRPEIIQAFLVDSNGKITAVKS